MEITQDEPPIGPQLRQQERPQDPQVHPANELGQHDALGGVEAAGELEPGRGPRIQLWSLVSSVPPGYQ